MRRRTRKQWYQFHLEKSVKEAQLSVYKEYSESINRHEKICFEAKCQLEDSLKRAPVLARFSEFFGIDTEYYTANIRPHESDILVAYRALEDLYERRESELKRSEKQGEHNYLQARETRKQEAEARVERVAQRKHARRVRYLEESPALRSAGRVLKQLLIQEQAQDGEWILCYYCKCTIPASESHLEHKRPVSRGGKNSKGNLVLSCAPCNLKKGRKTAEEFMRSMI